MCNERRALVMMRRHLELPPRKTINPACDRLGDLGGWIYESTVQEKVIYNRNHQGVPVLDNPVLMLCMATASASARAVMQTDLFGQQLPRSALEACSQPRARFWKLIPERERGPQCFKQKSCWTDPVSDTGLIR